MNFYSILAKLLPTHNVVGLVSFLSTFAEKLAEAEARQMQIAQNYAVEAAAAAAKRDEALAVAQKAGKLSLKIADLTN